MYTEAKVKDSVQEARMSRSGGPVRNLVSKGEIG